LLDTYSGTTDFSLTTEGVKSLAALRPYIRTAEALQLLEIDQVSLSAAAQIGQARARIEQVAALEMLRCQRAGDLPQAQAWRTLITLPQFASGVSGEMLLQTSNIEQAKSSEVSHALAKEYLQWQTMRVRQLLDFLQEQVVQNMATKEVVEAYGTEIRTLAGFPPSLLQAAAVQTPGSLPGAVKWLGGAELERNIEAMSAWRGDVESALPNLLTEKDIGRMQRLLIRFIKLVPREYQNGAHHSTGISGGDPIQRTSTNISQSTGSGLETGGATSLSTIS
jgi:high-affinity iron transporter